MASIYFEHAHRAVMQGTERLLATAVRYSNACIATSWLLPECPHKSPTSPRIQASCRYSTCVIACKPAEVFCPTVSDVRRMEKAAHHEEHGRANG
jgi:hypothetical protein